MHANSQHDIRNLVGQHTPCSRDPAGCRVDPGDAPADDEARDLATNLEDAIRRSQKRLAKQQGQHELTLLFRPTALVIRHPGFARVLLSLQIAVDVPESSVADIDAGIAQLREECVALFEGVR